MGQGYDGRGFWETMLNSGAAPEPNQPGQVWTLADEIQRLMGADAQPDPLFFEESWTLGAPTAAENLRRRRRQQTEGVVFGEFDNLGAQAYVQQRAWWADDFAATQNDAATGEANAEWTLWRGEEPSARTEDSARQWEAGPSERANRSTSEAISVSIPMTQRHACRVLGVTETSSREQIRSAYRRMVGRWHPDRMQHSSDETRRMANEQMIAINQAYSLLREGRIQQAA